MLSREAHKERNLAFWNAFKKRMRKHTSSDGRGINWLNYPTGVKQLYVRLDVDGKGTRFCIDLQPKDEDIRSIVWEQLTELKHVMENEMGEATAWSEHHHRISKRMVSRIYWEDTGLSFYRDEDFPKMEAFLEEKLLGFDRFYQEFKEILLTLVE